MEGFAAVPWPSADGVDALGRVAHHRRKLADDHRSLDDAEEDEAGREEAGEGGGLGDDGGGGGGGIDRGEERFYDATINNERG